MAKEINLVPDIKNEMIKTLKLRNYIFFACIVISSISIAVTVISGLTMGGQQLALSSKQETLENMSKKLNSYNDLNDFLTFQDQASNIDNLTNNKQVLSRTFNTLSALLPTGADTITISELNVKLSDSPTFTFDAQANAGKEPFIDYNVLDSFKKSMQYMRYDYGDYVDKNGTNIPAYCIIETGSDGSFLSDSEKGLYAFWTIEAEGCNPSSSSDSSNSSDSSKSSNTSKSSNSDYTFEEYEGQKVVRIWRTPQYSDWYKASAVSDQPYMDLDGNISNVAHFNSSCITYSGTISQGSASPKWSESNESCLLVPDGIDGINISDSSNGRGSNGDLVLRFSAVISLTPAIYSFENHHVLAIAPSGHYNVTDSYVQIQSMFAERAADCEAGDTTCSSNTVNSNGSNSDSKNNSKTGGQ